MNGKERERRGDEEGEKQNEILSELSQSLTTHGEEILFLRSNEA